MDGSPGGLPFTAKIGLKDVKLSKGPPRRFIRSMAAKDAALGKVEGTFVDSNPVQISSSPSSSRKDLPLSTASHRMCLVPLSPLHSVNESSLRTQSTFAALGTPTHMTSIQNPSIPPSQLSTNVYFRKRNIQLTGEVQEYALLNRHLTRKMESSKLRLTPTEIS